MNLSLADFLGRALVPVVVYFGFALARRYVSAASVKAPEQQVSMADLDSRFSRTQWTIGISMLVVGVVFAMSTHALFVWLS
jgi:hypothetical protein